MEEIKPVECNFPTPLLTPGAPNESTDQSEDYSGNGLAQTEWENVKEIGPKYELEETKYTHIEKHNQMKAAAESSERYCVKVIGTTSEFTIYCILAALIYREFKMYWGHFREIFYF